MTPNMYFAIVAGLTSMDAVALMGLLLAGTHCVYDISQIRTGIAGAAGWILSFTLFLTLKVSVCVLHHWWDAALMAGRPERGAFLPELFGMTLACVILLGLATLVERIRA